MSRLFTSVLLKHFPFAFYVHVKRKALINISNRFTDWDLNSKSVFIHSRTDIFGVFVLLLFILAWCVSFYVSIPGSIIIYTHYVLMNGTAKITSQVTFSYTPSQWCVFLRKLAWSWHMIGLAKFYDYKVKRRVNVLYFILWWNIAATL